MIHLYYRTLEKIKNFYHYHRSAIKNRFKYGVYFGDIEAYNLVGTHIEYIVPRLKCLIEWNKKIPQGITLTEEDFAKLGDYNHYFVKQDGCYQTTEDGWIGILQIIVDGFEQKEPSLIDYPFHNKKWSESTNFIATISEERTEEENAEYQQYIVDYEKYNQTRQESLRLLYLLHDNLWH